MLLALTDYEYDLSDITLTLVDVGSRDFYDDLTFGNCPEDSKVLTSFCNFTGGLSAAERQIKDYHPSRGYLLHTLGGNPLLKRRTEKERIDNGYRNSAPLTIQRTGLRSDGVTIGLVDDIRVQYDGNRPIKVSDYADRVILESSLDFDSPEGRSNYKYDASGRLIGDSGSDIQSIKYAPNDMPIALQTPSTDITYSYRADGAKLKMTVSQQSGVIGSVQARYDVGPFRFIRSNGGQLLIDRINLPWGYIDNKGRFNIYIKDYQGNVRAVYSQLGGMIVQQTDYYPYGLPKAKSTNSEVNSFKYGSKELSTELGMPFYDFEARMQLPTLGMFNRPDPKASVNPSLNTFSYCGGNPVNYADPSGEVRIYLSNDDALNNRAKKQGYDINRIHIVAHGATTHIYNEKTGNHIKTGKGLKEVIYKSEAAKDLISKPYVEIILHSCDTGKDGDRGAKPLAQKISKGIRNAIITAPNGVINIKPNGRETVNTESGEKTGLEGWRVFLEVKRSRMMT